MITFEDMFDTQLWDTKEELFFTRHTPSPLARYEANFTNKTLRKRAQVETPTLKVDAEGGIKNRKGAMLTRLLNMLKSGMDQVGLKLNDSEAGLK